MPPKKKYKDFESAMARLEEITERLESSEASLEESIDLYTEGLEIAKFCSEKLGQVEKKIKVIVEKAGGPVEVDFDDQKVNG
jgi:exodeoxyribonuclease VII small subunit